LECVGSFAGANGFASGENGVRGVDMASEGMLHGLSMVKADDVETKDNL